MIEWLSLHSVFSLQVFCLRPEEVGVQNQGNEVHVVNTERVVRDESRSASKRSPGTADVVLKYMKVTASTEMSCGPATPLLVTRTSTGS